MDQASFNHIKKFLSEERFARFEEVIQHRTRHITYVLEDVFQPHNASAVLRSCDCFGIQDIHIIETRNTYKTDKNIALGAGKWVSLHKYSDAENTTTNCLNHLKNQGYSIVATTPHKDDFTVSTLPLDKPLAIVFGTELTGITEEVVNSADYFMQIPMYGFTESLNISVAAAITAQNLYERLIASDIDWKLSEQESKELLFQWMMKSVKNSDKILDLFLKEQTAAGKRLT